MYATAHAVTTIFTTFNFGSEGHLAASLMRDYLGVFSLQPHGGGCAISFSRFDRSEITWPEAALELYWCRRNDRRGRGWRRSSSDFFRSPQPNSPVHALARP